MCNPIVKSETRPQFRPNEASHRLSTRWLQQYSTVLLSIWPCLVLHDSDENEFELASPRRGQPSRSALAVCLSPANARPSTGLHTMHYSCIRVYADASTNVPLNEFAVFLHEHAMIRRRHGKPRTQVEIVYVCVWILQ